MRGFAQSHAERGEKKAEKRGGEEEKKNEGSIEEDHPTEHENESTKHHVTFTRERCYLDNTATVSMQYV